MVVPGWSQIVVPIVGGIKGFSNGGYAMARHNITKRNVGRPPARWTNDLKRVGVSD